MSKVVSSKTCFDCIFKAKSLKSDPKYFCKKTNYFHEKQDRFFTCLWFEEKGEQNAQETQQISKPPHLEKGSESPQEEQYNNNARRNSALATDDTGGFIK